VKRMAELGIEADLIRWTDSFMTDRQVKLVLDGVEGKALRVETGIPQGSPVAPILFVTYLSGIFEQVEQTCETKGLSFADDVALWVEGKTDKEVAEKLTKASEAACKWAATNGVEFDLARTEGVFFSRGRRAPTAVFRTGGREVPFNKKATRWLGIWLDTQLTLGGHQKAMMKKGRKAMGRLQRLTREMGLTPANCRKVMSACVQSVAMYGSELWWKGATGRGMAGGVEELQKLVNREARAVTGCFRTTNMGALSAEAGIRPASTQLDNRQRNYSLRLAGLPEGMQAREIRQSEVGIGKRLEAVLGYSGQIEKTVLQSVPDPLKVTMVIEERAKAKAEAEAVEGGPGLTIYTDGSRMESGAAGYSVVWRKAQRWVGIKSHMGYNQEAFDTECAALARALEVATRRQTPPVKVTIFTDSQAAMARIASEEPGPGQKYAIEARRWTRALRESRPEVEIEIRWCPAHEGIVGNEKADEWAKLAAEEPDAHGVEWLTRADSYGRRLMP
jgi:ribonuclease HI